MADHATLSASGAKRWLECPPSALLEKDFPDETSVYASEGTFAHSLAELHLNRAACKTIKPAAFKKKLSALQQAQYYSGELEEYVDKYVVLVTEHFNNYVASCGDALMLLEQKLDFSEWVPDGFGTGDVVIISDGMIEVIDLKYGKGVPVSAENNPQTRLYGLGAINAYDMLYDFDRVRMTIIQPRLDSISTEEMSVNELVSWAEEYVKPRADLAIAGGGEFEAGDHCRFCKARAACRARAEKNLVLARYDFADAPLLSNTEIADVLERAEELQKWTKDIQEYALDQAVNQGVRFPGRKLVEGRSNRVYTSGSEVIFELTKAGYDAATLYKPQELLGITAMEKKLGKKKFGELLSEVVVKPAGKPVLVPDSDKRPEINSIYSAIADFK